MSNSFKSYKTAGRSNNDIHLMVLGLDDSEESSDLIRRKILLMDIIYGILTVRVYVRYATLVAYISINYYYYL